MKIYLKYMYLTLLISCFLFIGLTAIMLKNNNLNKINVCLNLTEVNNTINSLMNYSKEEINNLKNINYSCNVKIPECKIPDCICNCDTKEKECKTRIKTVITDNCTKKLNLCNIRLDVMNDQLYECMILNDTLKSEDLKRNLTNCIKYNEELEDKLKEIKNVI